MKRLLAILIVAVMLFSLTACNPSPAAEKPATPSNVSADDKGLITWDAVDGAIGYVITIDGTDYSVTANSYQASSVTKTFTYSIRAVGKDYQLSEPTQTFTFEAKEIVAPGPDLNGVTVGIESGSEIHSGKTLQLTANVSGAEDTSVTWKVTLGQDVITVDATGLVTAKEVTSDVVVEVEARSNANSEKFATKTLTVVAKPDLTQEMLDALQGERVYFDGFINITVYSLGPFSKVESTYTTVIKTKSDGEHWYGEYINSTTGAAAGLYCANHDGYATNVGLNFNNSEEYEPMLDDDGNKISWEDSGLYNNFNGLTVDDFTFNEDTWRYEYNGDDGLDKKVIASANPYDFVVNGFALIISGDVISGIYAKSGDDYTVVDGYRSIQEMTVAIVVDDSIEVPTVNKYIHMPVHDKLQTAIDNMKNLTSYTMDYKEIVASAYATGVVEAGFVETITPDTLHFVPYSVTYTEDLEEIHTPDPSGSYGYRKFEDNLYNAYYNSETGYVASRAYQSSVNEARPSFDFAAAIFTSHYEDEETGETRYYVADMMSGVASTFYNCVGNDKSLYGIFATRGYTSQTESFTPYVVVKDGYITEACFYFNMGLMYGVVELKYSDFNTTVTPAEATFEGFEVRQVPDSWTQLSIIVPGELGDTESDEERNAQEYWNELLGDSSDEIPFFGNALGDTYGFGMATLRKPATESNVKKTVQLYYDVPLDIDYTISSSLEKVQSYLVSLGYVKNEYGEYHKGDIWVAPVDNQLDLYIYVWVVPTAE